MVKQEITEALAGYARAVRAKDVDGFVSLYATDVRVFDMWDRWSYDGAAAWRGMAADGWEIAHEDTSAPAAFDTGKVQLQRP